MPSGCTSIAVFVKKEDLEPYLNLLKKMGIQPISIQIPAVSALNLFFYHDGDKGNEVSVLLDVNEPFLEMNILEGKEWKDSFHLPAAPEEKEEAILQAFRRSDLKENAFPGHVLCLRPGRDRKSPSPNFGEADGMKGVSSPPVHQIEAADG